MPKLFTITEPGIGSAVVLRMKHVKAFAIGLIANEIICFIAACLGLSYFEDLHNDGSGYRLYEYYIETMDLNIAASILAIVVYARLLWIDFDSDKYGKWMAVFMNFCLFVVRFVRHIDL